MEQKSLLRAGQAAWRLTLEEVRTRFPASAAASLRAIPGSRPGASSGISSGSPKVRGDHDLNPGYGPPPDKLREAAVLVPLVERRDEVTVIFTLRTAHLSAHAGQISFPGGRREPEDRSPEDTALRETEEEIGISSDSIEILGRLDTYVTRTGFRVTPVVGLVHPPVRFAPDPTEVAEVFEVPLSVILDPANPRRHSLMHLGVQRFFYAFPYGQRYIWGATAGMLVNLREVLSAGPLGDPALGEVPARQAP